MTPGRFISTVSGWRGRQIIKRLRYVVDLTAFGMLAVRNWYCKIHLFDTRSYSTIGSQIIFTGVDTLLPSITLIKAN